jgi:hypothetical protein
MQWRMRDGHVCAAAIGETFGEYSLGRARVVCVNICGG